MKDRDQHLLWESYSSIKTEAGETTNMSLPEDYIYHATSAAADGDIKGCLKSVGTAIAQHMINDIYYTEGPLADRELAERWDVKEGINHAIADLLGGAAAEELENLNNALRDAFHKEINSPEMGQPANGGSALDMLGYEPDDFAAEDPDQAAMDRADGV